MTRPKVDPDKRQRTAQACDSCKRRKQKCNGLQRCSTCEKRNLECMYTPTSLESGSQEPLGSPTKRRHVDTSPRILKMESGQTMATHTPSTVSWSQNPDGQTVKAESPELSQTKLAGTTRHFRGSNDRKFDSRSRNSTTLSTTSGATDDAEQVSYPRWIGDGLGGLHHYGVSASLSYLQLIRMIVGRIAGECEFTLDGKRHNIVENVVELPPGIRPTGVLPDRRTTDILIESFFVNTSGFIEVFHKDKFLQMVDDYFEDPLRGKGEDLCTLHLVLAIGLVMACPVQGTEAGAVIQRLQSEQVDRAELFYRNATRRWGPFEDADFWSVQVLLLISLYLLATSNRNKSYLYIGMAIQSAKALGLHRDESEMELLFSLPEQQLRRNVWRSLFVIDRFLAASLGRPVTISEADCSEHALDFLMGTSTAESPMSHDTGVPDSIAFDAAVGSSMSVGTTLRKIYSRRKISTLVGVDITDDLENWERELHQSLHCGRIMGGLIDPAEAIAILHVNLLHCHSVLLLTKPFFLYLIKRGYKMGYDESSPENQQKPPFPNRVLERLERFAEACIEAAQRTIILTRAALDANFLPQCNPFVIYFVFAAALILLTNEFTSLYHNPDASNSYNSVMRIFEYCEQRDAQAKRVKYIIECFHKATQSRPDKAIISLPGRKMPTILTDSQTFCRDPTSYFFSSANTGRQDVYMSDPSPTKGRVAVSLPTTHPEPRMVSMMPPTMQQPSPDGSVSLTSGMPAVSIAPGMDGLPGGEPDFEFDILMQNWNVPPPSSMGIQHSLHPVDTFSSYGLHQPQPLPQGNGLHHHVTPYPPPEYR